MADLTVKVPQGFPVGSTLKVYVDRVGDIIPQGTPVSTAVIQADSSVTLTGLSYGIPYQAGELIGGVWRSFLVEIAPPVPSTFDQLSQELVAHEIDTTDVHGVVATASLAVKPIAVGDLAFDPATQPELDTAVAGVGAPNVQTANYVLVLADAGKAVEMNSASARTVTVPPNSSVAFPIGAVIEVLRYGAGTVTMVAGAGVTIRSNGAKLAVGNQYSGVSLRKRDTDEWVLNGDLA